ncbi:hypothetical protein ACOSP7_002208 [Xanthoceras sorbifolium]
MRARSRSTLMVACVGNWRDQYAWKSGFRKVLFECDSLVTVNLLQKEATPFNPLFNLICSCKKLLLSSRDYHLSHTLRDNNKATDCLAGLGKKMTMGIVFFFSPFAEIFKFLEEDAGFEKFGIVLLS